MQGHASKKVRSAKKKVEQEKLQRQSTSQVYSLWFIPRVVN